MSPQHHNDDVEAVSATTAQPANRKIAVIKTQHTGLLTSPVKLPILKVSIPSLRALFPGKGKNAGVGHVISGCMAG
jgi:hypothetical protein